MSKKIKLLLYCTKAKPILRKLDNYFLDKHTDNYYWEKGQTVPYSLNGKIVAECDFEVEEINFLFNEGGLLKKNNGWRNYRYAIKNLNYGEFYKKACLSFGELDDYFEAPSENKKVGYAIHIKNLHIFDKPKELSEFDDMWGFPLKKAPQNMMYAFKFVSAKNEFKVNEYILISIQPQWMCKILNGEKTIEVRKKVLKEMLKHA